MSFNKTLYPLLSAGKTGGKNQEINRPDMTEIVCCVISTNCNNREWAKFMFQTCIF